MFCGLLQFHMLSLGLMMMKISLSYALVFEGTRKDGSKCVTQVVRRMQFD